MDANFVKMPGGLLRPACDADLEAMEKIKNGRLVRAKIEQPRNPQFMAKFHVMIGFAFDYWTPCLDPVSGVTPIKDRDVFREQVTIMAGFREAVVGFKGVRWRARSISFGSMEEDEFNSVYRAVFAVLWTEILKHVPNLSEQEAHNLINQMSEFA